MRGALRRRFGEAGEQGFAMIVVMGVIMLLSMLVAVLLATSLHDNTATAYDAHRDRSLAVAEAGITHGLTQLQADDQSAVITPVPYGTTLPDQDGNQFTYSIKAGTPANATAKGYFTIESSGSIAAVARSPIRRVRAVYGPVPSFTLAMYSATTLDVGGSLCVVGSIYAVGNITTGNGTVVAGTVHPDGTRSLQGSLISKTGSIDFNGAANASKCPTTTNNGDTVTTTGSSGFVPIRDDVYWDPTSPHTNNVTSSMVGGAIHTTPAPSYSIPKYVFDPRNYSNLQHYPYPASTLNGYGTPNVYNADGSLRIAEIKLTDAVSRFNSDTNKGQYPPGSPGGTGLSGSYVIWQANPSASTTVDLSNLTKVAGDTLIYTNAPITFGNTASIDPTPATATPLLQVMSAYSVSNGVCTTSGAGGDDCSIWGKNQLRINPNIAELLWSMGAIAFKNDCNSTDCNTDNSGSWYASSIKTKNGANVTYDPRVAALVGFGPAGLERTQWQELPPCTGTAKVGC